MSTIDIGSLDCDLIRVYTSLDMMRDRKDAVVQFVRDSYEIICVAAGRNALRAFLLVSWSLFAITLILILGTIRC